MQTEISEIAREMAKAYRWPTTKGAAVEKVKDKFPEADLNILWTVWEAIDAYVDMIT